MNIPKGWRQGQFYFNFLEFLATKGVNKNQNMRMADSFHLSDEEWDKYYAEFMESLK